VDALQDRAEVVCATARVVGCGAFPAWLAWLCAARGAREGGGDALLAGAVPSRAPCAWMSFGVSIVVTHCYGQQVSIRARAWFGARANVRL
jgi:hypothetical protein